MRVALIGYEANIVNRVGSNQYAFELIKALHQIDKKNEYQIYLPTPPLKDLPPARKGWEYRIAGPIRLWNFWGLPIALAGQKPRPDIVFNPGHYSPIFSLSPLAISIMDLGYLRFPEQFPERIYWKLRLWTSFSLQKARLIFAISQSTKNDIIKYARIEPERIVVTHPGYDKNRFHPGIDPKKVEKVKQSYGITGKYLLFLGSLKPNKNIVRLIEAFKLLIANYQSPITLVIAGKKGWIFEEVFRKTKQLALGEKVIFTGFVPDGDVPGLIAGAALFALPSLWEGFGIPAVEAMATGTPVLVSRAGSLPEVVGKAGVIVDPLDTVQMAKGILEIVANREFSEKLTKSGIDQAKKFDWNVCARKTIEALETMV